MSDEKINLKDEMIMCFDSPEYFFTTWCKILHPKKGLIPFTLYPYQKRWLDTIENNRFVISTKFRQGGFTTTTLLYFLYKCLFNLDKNVLYVCGTNREATYCHDLVERMLA